MVSVVVAAALCASACSDIAEARQAVDAHALTAEVLAATTIAPTPSTVDSLASSATNRPPADQPSAEVLCLAESEEITEAPLSVTTALADAAAHPGFDGLDVGVSVWIEAWGEVLAVNPDLALAPASNQKLLVAIGAHALLDRDAQLHTTIERRGDVLVVRPGGDPTLTSADLVLMAQQVADAGVLSADRLIIDAVAYPQEPRASGWLDWQIPTYVGPLSALMIDDNRWTRDAEFVADPALINGRRVAEYLKAEGVSVGTVELGSSPPGEVLAEHLSPKIDELVQSMLLASDNQHGDLLLVELGRITTGEGTLLAGASAVNSVLRDLCVEIDGTTDDGSGLSRRNQRSAREMRQILQALDGPSRDRLLAQLPVGGVSGTLASRFRTNPGRVHAKTGTIIGGRALSGYTTTDGGRDVVFSIIVNGEPDAASASLAAIDNLVNVLLGLTD